MIQRPKPRGQYIGFWPRALAQVVDNALALVFMLPAMLTHGWAFFDPLRPKPFSETFFGLIVPLCLLLWLWRRFQASPGKYLVGAKIIDAKTLGTPSNLQVVVRLLGYIPSMLAFGLGFFWVLFDARCQAWHDKLAGTLVVADDLPPEVGRFKLKTPAPRPKLD